MNHLKIYQPLILKQTATARQNWKATFEIEADVFIKEK